MKTLKQYLSKVAFQWVYLFKQWTNKVSHDFKMKRVKITFFPHFQTLCCWHFSVLFMEFDFNSMATSYVNEIARNILNLQIHSKHSINILHLSLRLIRKYNCNLWLHSNHIIPLLPVTLTHEFVQKKYLCMTMIHNWFSYIPHLEKKTTKKTHAHKKKLQ